MPKPVVIVGGGISGLSLAHYLSKARPDVPIHVIEKSNRLGGWIASSSFRLNGRNVLYEEGPRSLRAADNGRVTLSLAEELNLQNEVIGISSAGIERNIFVNGHVTPIPSTVLGLLSSSLTRKAIPSILSEYFKAPLKNNQDESIDSFFSRRFSPYVARTFVAPVVVGIYGGNSKDLSIRCTFSKFKNWEETQGSILKGLFSPSLHTRTSEWVDQVQKKGIFSFQGGLETLVESLESSLRNRGVSLHTETSIEDICQAADRSGDEVNDLRLLLSSGKEIECSNLFFAVNAPSLQQVLSRYRSEKQPQILPEIQERLSQISYASLALVHVAYAKPPPSKVKLNGFGYLCSPDERQQIIGVTFDSNVFPNQSPLHSTPLQQQTDTSTPVRLSVFLGGHNVHPESVKVNHTTRPFEVVKKALEGLEAHLGITTKPDWIDTSISLDCIPQYSLNYLTRLEQIKSKMGELSDRIHLLGPSFHLGVGVNDCIANAKSIADHWSDRL